MGIIFMITMGIFGIIAKLLWDLHEVPVHKAQHDNSLMATVVFGLALCGLFINKTWWVLAIFIAFTPWQTIGIHISRMIQNGMTGNTKSVEEDQNS